MMAVYVDKVNMPYGRMTMCHMVADSMVELLVMADTIGVARRWFQPFSYPHFDICLAKRQQAVMKGAIEVSRKEFVNVMNRYRERLIIDKNELDDVRKAMRIY